MCQITTKKAADGKLYWYDEVKEEFICDEQGYFEPAHVCICNAWEASECACGAWDVEVNG